MRKACYVAGPMRGIEEFNHPAFNAAAAALREKGWEVFNPAEYDEKDTVSQTQHDYARRDLGLILNNLEAGRKDALVLLPGWQLSIGARAERAVSEWIGLEILTLEEALYARA
jgi:Tfp pilus assembly protein PilX